MYFTEVVVSSEVRSVQFGKLMLEHTRQLKIRDNRIMKTKFGTVAVEYIKFSYKYVS